MQTHLYLPSGPYALATYALAIKLRVICSNKWETDLALVNSSSNQDILHPALSSWKGGLSCSVLAEAAAEGIRLGLISGLRLWLCLPLVGGKLDRFRL